ncbi:MAG: T9SS type A sorting domain-containing protein [Chloroherpetonaceae bacterium]|nr:T9SS type A sorting domain-containing protein [Chloroherpetonaceae bacterium]
MKFIITVFVLLLLTTTKTGAQVLPPLPIPIGAGSAQVWGDSIYVIGGSNNWGGNIVYPRIYRFNGTSWAYHDSIPDSNVWDVETVIKGNEIFLIAGWPSGPRLTRKYNLSTRLWTSLAALPTSQSFTWGTTAEVIGDSIYLVNPGGNTYRYSIPGNSWTELPNAGRTGSNDLSSIAFNGEMYVIGFRDSSFVKYSPQTGTWSTLAKSPYQVGACAMGIVNEQIYCIGGNLNGGTGAFYNTVIAYNILTNSWRTDSLRISGKRHWMARAEYRGGLYVLGGIDSLANSVNTVEQIIPQGTSSVRKITNTLPRNFELLQNYPNPFNPSTTIRYRVASASEITLSVFDVLGREVASLFKGWQAAGEYGFDFNAAERGLSSGIYFYRLISKERIETKKMILAK